MCGYCNVAYVSLLNDEVSSECNKQNQPGTLSNKQNQPGTLSYFGVIIFKLQIWQAPPCMFLDLDSDSVHEHAKRKQLGQYPAMLTSLVSGPDILLKPTPQMIP